MARPDQPRVLRATELPVPAAAKQRRLRILFVCGEFPNPVHGGGSRVADFIKVLGERHEVFVAAWYDRRRDHDAYVALAPYARVLRGLPFEDLEGGCVEKMLQMLDHQPADVVHYEWPRSLQSFDRRLGRHHIYTHMEVVSHSLWLDLKRLAPLSPEWCQRMSQLLTILGVETLDAARADLQIAVTGKDGQFLSRFRPDLPFYVVNHGINLDDFVLPERTPEPNTVVFTGNFAHYPNQDAVHFFMRDIHPVVRAAVPELRVLLVGANPPPDIRAYHDGRRIIVTGHVPDVRPYIQQAAVCMAPLISGAGLRTKVVQYAALRRPSVITPIAAADLDFEPGREVLLTADPREFARQLSELLLHPAQAMELARAARVKALALYDNRKIAEVGLGNLYQHLLSTEERS
jgi:glycosyltransferase involved in cell wall biosynthesis